MFFIAIPKRSDVFINMSDLCTYRSNLLTHLSDFKDRPGWDRSDLFTYLSDLFTNRSDLFTHLSELFTDWPDWDRSDLFTYPSDLCKGRSDCDRSDVLAGYLICLSEQTELYRCIDMVHSADYNWPYLNMLFGLQSYWPSLLIIAEQTLVMWSGEKKRKKKKKSINKIQQKLLTRQI